MRQHQQPPTTIQYQQTTYTLLEAQSSEPVQRAHDRIQALINRGQDPHAGTIRRLEKTTKPEKVHGIIQAAQHLAERAKGPDRSKWEEVADAGKRRHKELTGEKYKEQHYDTPETVKPAVTPEAPPAARKPKMRVVKDEPETKPRKKKLPTSVSKGKKPKKGPSKTVQAPGESKWVRVIRKRDGKIIQVRRGKHLNKKKYAPLKTQKKAASVAPVPTRIQYQGQEYVLQTAAWESLPKGWTSKSLKSMWRSLTGKRKHRITACMKKLEGHVDDPGAFCASLARRMKGKG